MKIYQKPQFQRTYKKLYKNQFADTNNAIHSIIDNPEIGQAKIGDLAGLRVHKFRMAKQQMLLAYSYENIEQTLVLVALGSHQNFYQDVKNLG